MVASFSRDNKSTNGRAVNVDPSLTRARRLVRAAGYLSPRLGARVAKRIWERPRNYDMPARESALVASAEKVRIPFGTASLAGCSWGAGPTVLLVHGWEGRGSQLAYFAAPLVERGFRVVAFDAPAHGRNGGRESSLFSFADAVLAAGRRFGPLHGIVAHSLGCAATMVALGSGLPLPRLVFVAPADPSQAPPRFASMLELTDGVKDQLLRSLERQYGIPLDAVAVSRLAPRMTAALKVIHDADDRFVPLSDAETIAAAWPDAELHVTRELGHHRILRDQGVVDLVVDYIDAPSEVRSAWQPEAFQPSAALIDGLFRPGDIGLTAEDVAHDLSFGQES